MTIERSFNYSYPPVLCTPPFLCTVAIFECNSSPFHLIQVAFYRDMSGTLFELALASLDDVNHSVGQFDLILGCVSKISESTPRACDRFQPKFCCNPLIKTCDKGWVLF